MAIKIADIKNLRFKLSKTEGVGLSHSVHFEVATERYHVWLVLNANKEWRLGDVLYCNPIKGTKPRTKRYVLANKAHEPVRAHIYRTLDFNGIDAAVAVARDKREADALAQGEIILKAKTHRMREQLYRLRSDPAGPFKDDVTTTHIVAMFRYLESLSADQLLGIYQAMRAGLVSWMNKAS